VCEGAPPTKTQGVFLFFNCADPTTGTIIAAINTDPFSGIEQLGTVSFDTDHGIATTKNGVLTQVMVPIEIDLSCVGDTVTATTFGIMTLKFSALPPSDSCPLSGSIKILGVGDMPGPAPFVVNNGSSGSIGKRSSSITSFPLF